MKLHVLVAYSKQAWVDVRDRREDRGQAAGSQPVDVGLS